MRRSKYFAVPTVVNGIRFASKKEARRFQQLAVLEQVGEISGLNVQPRYALFAGETPIATYVGDFEYWERGRLVTEDVKGMKTPAYRIKARLFAANYGREIRET